MVDSKLKIFTFSEQKYKDEVRSAVCKTRQDLIARVLETIYETMKGIISLNFIHYLKQNPDLPGAAELLRHRLVDSIPLEHPLFREWLASGETGARGLKNLTKEGVRDYFLTHDEVVKLSSRKMVFAVRRLGFT